MPILDFKEIPEAHKATGEQDTFELFARDFLEMRGFKIVSIPGRGADGGKDLIVEETRVGIAGETKIRWLVSCKHRAHSGSSVGIEIETNIRDRVENHQCHGFIGFYSTLPSSSLVTNLSNLKTSSIECVIYDSVKIEGELLGSKEGVKLAERFFPISLARWKRNNPSPIKLFGDAQGLKCENCGADLLKKEAKQAVVVSWRKNVFSIPGHVTISIEDIYWCCKGDCDEKLQKQFHYLYPGYSDAWADLSDICIPTVYMKWVLSIIRDLHNGNTYSNKAMDKRISLLFEIFPFVTRDLTDKEQEELQNALGSWNN